MIYTKFALILLIGSTIATPVAKVKSYYDRSKFYNHKYYEGDILSHSSNSLKYHAVTSDSFLWPNGELVYTVEPSVDSSLIFEAMNQINQATNGCIKFREKQETDFDWVHIFSGEGCFAEVGKKGGQQQLSLGEGCSAVGVYIHELLHTLGFYHHHSRSDRDEYLDIFWENIIPNLASNFRKLDASENQLLTPFDYQSIMMYGSLAFSKDNIHYTMLPKDYTVQISDPGTKSSMTQLDITALKKLYSCDASPSNDLDENKDKFGENNDNNESGNNEGGNNEGGNNEDNKFGDNFGDNHIGDHFGDKFGDKFGENHDQDTNNHDKIPLPPIPSLKDYDKHTSNEFKKPIKPFRLNEVTANFGNNGELIDFDRVFKSIIGKK